jgi:predicted aconitase with swiveling domain
MSDLTMRARVLVGGSAAGEALVLPEALSLWGGLDPGTGLVVDPRHPSHGASVRGRVLVLPAGKGSSSSSSILLEAVRAGTAPAAIVIAEADPILALGAAVAREMYGAVLPVVVLPRADYDQLRDGQRLQIGADGAIDVGVADGRESG